MSPSLTPVDILNIRFRRRLHGYATGEVDDFVRRVASDMEAVLTELAAQREKIGAMERELSQFRSMETTLRDALILAQKAADDTRAAAHAQADARIQEAQTRVRDLDAQAQARLAEINRQIEMLRQERRRLARDLRAQLNAHLAWLAEEVEADRPDAAVVQERSSAPAGLAETEPRYGPDAPSADAPSPPTHMEPS